MTNPRETEALLARLREESAALQKTAWSRPDGGQECCLSSNLADEAASAIESLQAEIERMREALRAIIDADNEAPGFGLLDCADNDGEPYQSADLAAALIAARATLNPDRSVS